MLLTAADIDEIRRHWVADLIDYHPEWGTTPAVAADGAVGDPTISLTGLQGPTLRLGTPFLVRNASRRDRYAIDAETDVTAGAAAPPISPVLVAPVYADDEVEPEPNFRSVFNSKKRRLMWQDSDLRDLADQAEGTYGARIAAASDSKRMLFRAIRMLATDELLQPGSEFIALLLGDDPHGTAQKQIDVMREQQREDNKWLKAKTRGPAMVFLER